jgi:Lon protease-like protein
MDERAMFPLGTVLVPSMALPLHVFEPRYRQLVQDVLVDGIESEKASFGVVLIERGSEVGGGEVRTDVGTLARIVEVAELPGGRYGIGAVGTERFRVREWLPDDPYPRASTEPWPDPPVEPSDHELAAAVEAQLRRLLALAAEIGERVTPATTSIGGDAASMSFQMTAMAPLGPMDRQQLLAAESVSARLETLRRMLAEQRTVLERRLGER